MRVRTLTLILVCVLSWIWSASAGAQPQYLLSGNARFQQGSGLPNPLGFTPPPVGKIAAIAGAKVQQTSGPDPKQLTMPPGQLAWSAAPTRLGLFSHQFVVFEVRTGLGFSFPRQQATLRANGRTGAATVTLTGGVVPGRLRYVKGANQFGGPAQAAVSGTAQVVVKASGTPPCTACIAFIVPATPPPTGFQGAPFGFSAKASHPAPAPGLFFASVKAAGTIQSTKTSLGAGLPNTITGLGGPWTTGMVTVTATTPMGNLQRFTLTGSDNRLDGVGSISLVSGGLVQSSLQGPRVALGWLNLTVGPKVPEPGVPALTSWGLGALVLAMAAVGLRRMRKV